MQFPIRITLYSLIFPSSCCGLSLLIIFLLNLSLLLQCILCLQIIGLLGYNIYQERGDKLGLSVSQVFDRHWVLISSRGTVVEHHDLQLLRSFILLPRFMVLHFKMCELNRKLHVVFYPDSLSAAEFRRLRVGLMI